MTKNPCPEQSAPLLSRLFFLWNDSLIKTGYSRPLQQARGTPFDLQPNAFFCRRHPPAISPQTNAIFPPANANLPPCLAGRYLGLPGRTHHQRGRGGLHRCSCGGGRRQRRRRRKAEGALPAAEAVHGKPPRLLALCMLPRRAGGGAAVPAAAAGTDSALPGDSGGGVHCLSLTFHCFSLSFTAFHCFSPPFLVIALPFLDLPLHLHCRQTAPWRGLLAAALLFVAAVSASSSARGE